MEAHTQYLLIDCQMNHNDNILYYNLSSTLLIYTNTILLFIYKDIIYSFIYELLNGKIDFENIFWSSLHLLSLWNFRIEYTFLLSQNVFGTDEYMFKFYAKHCLTAQMFYLLLGSKSLQEERRGV